MLFWCVSRVPRSSTALLLILSSSLRHGSIIRLPVDKELDLIWVAAVDAADLVGLLLEYDVLGAPGLGVGAALGGVCGSDGGRLFA